MKINRFLIIVLVIISFIVSSCSIQFEREEENEDINQNNINAENINDETEGINDLYNQDIKKEEIKQLIGSFTTEILNPNNENRVHNIKLACSKINGMILSPGEVFSYNDTVGEAVKENGFKPAKVIVNKESKMGEGGGICQVSSTIYNAVLEANLKIVERHKHSKEVPYIGKDMDATVAYGNQDFKFKNNREEDIVIEVGVEGNHFVVARIYSIE